MSIAKLQEDLNDAVMNVARCAQELSDGAEQRPANRGAPYENGIVCQKDDMDALREALKTWKEVTEKFMDALHG